MVWDEKSIKVFPIREFKQPKVLRARGIKVITAGFSELTPIDSGVREGLLDNWKARWQKDAEIITAEHDLVAMRIKTKEREKAIKGIVSYLSKILETENVSEEAQLIQLFQVLDNLASDEKTSELLPPDTLNILQKLQEWLIDNNIKSPEDFTNPELENGKESDQYD